MTSSPMLKNCPFCGGEAQERDDLCRGDFAIQCVEDECGAGTRLFDDPREAITAWNARPDTPARPDREAVKKVLRDHIKVDATGLAPAVASAFVTGIDEAASAVLALLPPADVGDE